MPGHQVPDVEGHLLGLGEVVGGVGVERQLPDGLHRRELLGHHLGRVEQVDALEGLVAVVRRTIWMPSSYSGIGPRLDRVGQVAPVEVGVDPAERSALPPTPGSGRPPSASSGT